MLSKLSTTLPRAALLVPAAALALFSASISIRASERRGEAGLLAGMNPSDGIVVLQAELHALAADPNHKIAQSSLNATRATLPARPLNPQVLALIAVSVAGPDGTSVATADLMKLADRMTRREPVSQMWMIEAASAAGDVLGAVRHYNTLMSTTPDTFLVLFPVLTSAIDFPEVREALRGTLRGGPIWAPNFLPYAASNAKIDSYLAMIGADYQVLRDPPYAEANAEFIYRLAAAGRGDKAFEFASRVLAQFDPHAFQEFTVSKSTLDPRMGKLAWRLGSSNGVAAELASGEVNISVSPGANMVALSRDFVVKPGSISGLSISLIGDTGMNAAAVKIKASCANDAAAQAGSFGVEQSVPVSAEKTTTNLSLQNTGRCSLIRIQVHVVGPDGQIPGSIRIVNLSMTSL